MNQVQSKTAGFLRKISVGKYDQGLYMDQRRQQSSICGGLFTILITIVFFAYLAVIFSVIVQRKDFTLTENTVLFSDSGLLNQTVSQLYEQFPLTYALFVSRNTPSKYQDCGDITFLANFEEVQVIIANTSY
jgi:hypothetical protein